MKKKLFLTLFILINIALFEGILSLFDPERILVKGFDKELLFQFVDEASINEYYNSIKISDLSIEEESLYKLY